MVIDKSRMISHVENVATLAGALRVLAETQKFVSGQVPGCMDEPTSPDAVRSYVLCCISELIELLDEFPKWKPWKKEHPVDRQKLAAEFADILAFLGIITVYVMRAGDLGALDLAWAYKEKTAVNIDRIAGKVEGYGV